MQAIVKPGKEKHPDHPSRDPLRKKMEAQGESRLRRGKLKFENEAEKRDYMRQVNSNPHNVPGYPPFYPPAKVPPSHGFGDGKPTEMLPCGHRWTTMSINTRGEKRLRCRYGGDFPAEVIRPDFKDTIEINCNHPITDRKES